MKRKIISTFVSLLFILLIPIIAGCRKESPELILTPVVQYVDINSATIAYKMYGTGEPLILCTGYATHMDMWSTGAMEKLSENFTLILFDYRGMGLSTNTDSSMSIASMAGDVNSILEAINISSAHVLGWSMGSYVAQMFALQFPEKVKTLTLYASNCGDTLTVNPSPEIIAILENPESSPEALLGTLFPDDWLAVHPEPWTVMPETTEPYQYETIGMQYEAVQGWLSPGGGSAGLLQEMKMPVMLICGSLDKVVPAINSTMLSEGIPYSSLVRIPDTGHGLMYQEPEVFAAYVITFISTCKQLH
jgi:pimeloyl-ACP methyl ester carboxylesterase